MPSTFHSSVLTAFPGTSATPWRECLAHADFPTHYTSPEYFLEPNSGEKAPFAVLALKDQQVFGVLTGFKKDGLVVCGGSMLPQVCCRSDASPDEISLALAEGLLSQVDRRDRHIAIYTWSELAGFERLGFRHTPCPESVVVLDLRLTPDELFRQCNRGRKSTIRHAIKSGVTVTPYEEDRDFDETYEILRDWCQFKKQPLNSRETQKAFFRLHESRLVLVARHEGRIVGVSSFRFQRGGLVEYAANWSRREDTKLRPNELLMWRAIEWAATHGFTLFSMAAAHRFVLSFGGRLVTTHRYSMDRTYLKLYDFKDTCMRWRRIASRRLRTIMPRR